MTKYSAFLFKLLVLIFLYLPIMVLMAYSMNNSQYSLVWHGFTTKWYQLVLNNQELWRALSHSLFLGITASSIACTLSFFACIRLHLLKPNAQFLFNNSIIVLIIIPDIIFAVAYLLIFNLLHIPLGFTSLLIAHISFCIPFTVITVNTAIASLDKNLYRAAIDLGAGYGQSVRRVFLPLCMPAIISAFLLGFTLSFDDVIISYFVSGPSFEILPLKIYSMVRAGVTPEINALCSLILLISFLIIAIAHRLVNRTKK